MIFQENIPLRSTSVRYSTLLNNAGDVAMIVPESSSVQTGARGSTSSNLDCSPEPGPSGSSADENFSKCSRYNAATKQTIILKPSASQESIDLTRSQDDLKLDSKSFKKSFAKLFRRKKTNEGGKFHSNDDLPNAQI